MPQTTPQTLTTSFKQNCALETDKKRLREQQPRMLTSNTKHNDQHGSENSLKSAFNI
jgi:hypothetical protein